MTPKRRVLLAGPVEKLLFHAPLTHNLTLLKGTAPPTFARSTAATVWCYDSSDNWVLLTIPANEPRFEGARYIGSGLWSDKFSTGVAIPASTLKGYFAEGQRTNYVLYNRDLTNAAWTKSNCTAAKDQTGIDGTSNSASSLTATADNATCLQSITRSSSVRLTGCWIKRITGTGTINMTQDNGSTWTAVTVTGSWTRVNISSATAADPILGFRIVTSGDAVAIDYVQHEEAEYLTSDIETTSAAVLRNVDSLTYPAAGHIDESDFSVALEMVRKNNQVAGDSSAAKAPFHVGTYNTHASLVFGGYTLTNVSMLLHFGTSWSLNAVPFTLSYGTALKLAFRMASDLKTCKMAKDGSLSADLISAQSKSVVWAGTPQLISIGNHPSAGANANQSLTVKNVMIWKGALSDARLQAVTS
jgi:hypothetical protein